MVHLPPALYPYGLNPVFICTMYHDQILPRSHNPKNPGSDIYFQNKMVVHGILATSPLFIWLKHVFHMYHDEIFLIHSLTANKIVSSSFWSSTLYILMQQKNRYILLMHNSIQYFCATVTQQNRKSICCKTVA